MDKERNLSWWNNGHVFYFLSKRQTTVDTKLWNELTFKARRSFSKECPIKIASCGRRSIKHFWTSSNVVVTFSSVFFVMPLNLHKKGGDASNASINVKPVGWGGGVRARGGDLTNFKISWSNSSGWETKGQSKVSKKPPPQRKNLNKQYYNTI